MLKRKKQIKRIQKNKTNLLDLNFIIQKEIKKNRLRTKFKKNYKFNDFKEISLNTKRHKNYTHIPFVTIDGEESKDFDDAIYASSNKDNFVVMTAIADVSYYVKANSNLDNEAKERANSFYFPGMVIPMLPEFLSNNLCSLVPNEKRLCLVVEIEINSEGSIVKKKISRGIIKSRAKLTYNEVQNHIDKKNVLERDIGKHIDNIVKAYDSLKKGSLNRGKIELDIEEYEIKYLSEINQFKFSKKKSLISMKLIEEFMIITNKAIADFSKEKKIKILYRNHNKPSIEKMEKLKEFLKMFKNYLFNENSNLNIEFNKILKNKKDEKYNLLKDVILKCQSKATYNFNNEGHFGLALKSYTHFTSPIRRYSDLVVHREVCNFISNGDDKKTQNVNEILCSHLLEQEKKSENIERSIKEKACCIYLSKIKKKFFLGFIDGITEFGIFIKSCELPFSGLARIRDINSDYNIFNVKNNFISGKNKGIKFEMGQKVTFKIKKNNIERGLISLEKIRHEN